MFDQSLRIEAFLPAAGEAVFTGAMDLNVDIPQFSDNWRQGRLCLACPALPNFTDPSKSIAIELWISSDGGQTFRYFSTLATIIGASGGAAALSGDPLGRPWMPVGLPPSLPGPIKLRIVADEGVGDSTGSVLTCNFSSE